ncbi:hypothetical protein DPEC_G00140120 [Dallia pectoralis]|uniref:Uncharacterized protein n=1 Tax=Dallia pectoralis TaxID=75939 RepID=A0ACC2GMW4_DALPE|nr:hypothetical protein DPEC_G00140120 [Dallia pectoralis]
MLKEADYQGGLIPVSSLNDNSGKLDLLSVIVKIRPKAGWFWQKPKYRSKSYRLSDVLESVVSEDPLLTLAFKETDFVDFNGIVNDKMDAGGKIEMIGRVLDMSHTWIKQACAKPRAVLCILTERIMTTDACKVEVNSERHSKIGSNQSVPLDPTLDLQAVKLQLANEKVATDATIAKLEGTVGEMEQALTVCSDDIAELKTTIK